MLYGVMSSTSGIDRASRLYRSTHPSRYLIFTLVISVGGFLNGYDTGAIGAITTMPQFTMVFGELSPILRGFIVSFLLLMCATPGFFAGQLADRFGHLRVVSVGALTFCVGSALEGGSINICMLLVGRALAGIGEGLWLTNVSI
ncbi:hypothetical protein N7G274_004142 [Stereocaulon virgatum]|uniref:Major facilitator superfamily (MFS) profile domain-containing protein n=1 Tax=Stereocaulon virgatum TaxID=373712 RepID=A0ABR4AES5_9LECA